jgi:DNA replication protein DnaC
MADQLLQKWNNVFSNPGMTVAAIDRLVHRSTVFEMNIVSYLHRQSSSNKTSRRSGNHG